jgi:aldehyde:ferredoxin oxidoreductase
MEKIVGTSNRLLEIDLSTGEVRISTIDFRDRKMYLGGKGLGLKLLYDRLLPGIDPLSEENQLVFTMGVFLGTGVSCSGRFECVTKSPLTGLMVSSSCGGPFGTAYKTAGYDALIIKGKAKRPVYIRIDHANVSIEDASDIWGKNTDETQDYFKLGKKDGALVIGPAGENLVSYANVKSGHRFLGRGGIGAVMGSKKLKAVISHGGKYKIEPIHANEFKKFKKRAIRYINRNQVTANEYRIFGTASHVNKCNKTSILPINNFKDGTSEFAHQISGESFNQHHENKFSSCNACTILCGHKGTFNDGKIMQFPEYETVGLLGSNLGNFNRQFLAEWNEQCGLLGMDTISAGTTLSFVMEAGEKGLINTNLKFGSPEGVDSMLHDIAHRRGPGNEIANGTKWLSEKYGGKEFAMHVKGLELSAYDPRGSFGQGLSYAVANRGGCHLSAPVFALETLLGLLNPLTHRSKVIHVDFLENMFAAVNSLHTCQFTSYAYMLEPFVAKNTPKKLLKFLLQNLPRIALSFMDVSVYNKIYQAVTGISLSQKKMFKIGYRIHILERYMNTLEGISAKDDVLPERLTKEKRLSDAKNSLVPLGKMIKKYYRLKGYNSDGIPTQKTLMKCGIEIKEKESLPTN